MIAFSVGMQSNVSVSQHECMQTLAMLKCGTLVQQLCKYHDRGLWCVRYREAVSPKQVHASDFIWQTACHRQATVFVKRTDLIP